MTAPQFSSETPWDALVANEALDIVEEQDFAEWLELRKYSVYELDLDQLGELYEEWERVGR